MVAIRTCYAGFCLCSANSCVFNKGGELRNRHRVKARQLQAPIPVSSCAGPPFFGPTALHHGKTPSRRGIWTLRCAQLTVQRGHGCLRAWCLRALSPRNSSIGEAMCPLVTPSCSLGGFTTLWFGQSQAVRAALESTQLFAQALSGTVATK